MVIGIIGAMSIEIDGLLGKMTDVNEKTIGKHKFFAGKLHENSLVVCCCGIGKVNSATACSLMINSFEIDLIINIGVAGGIKQGIKQGDIVIASESIQHDFDARADGVPLGRVTGFDFTAFQSDVNSVKRMENVLKKLNYSFYIGSIASGDQFISDKEKARMLNTIHNAYACDMETAAIAHACYLLNKPFFAIRAISDNADGTAVVDFYTFVNEAAQRSINAIINFLNE